MLGMTLGLEMTAFMLGRTLELTRVNSGVRVDVTVHVRVRVNCRDDVRDRVRLYARVDVPKIGGDGVMVDVNKH